MHAAILSVSGAVGLAIAASLYRLGNIVGRLNTTVQGLDTDQRELRLVTDRHEKALSSHGTRLTILETRSSHASA